MEYGVGHALVDVWIYACLKLTDEIIEIEHGGQYGTYRT